MATTELKCERHHTPTHLSCAQCGKPACPKCLVWTEVGQKCRTCVPGRGSQSRTRTSQLLVVGSLVVALVVAVAIGTGAFSGDGDDDVLVAGNTGQRQAGLGQPARDGPLTFVVTKFECPGKELNEGGLRRTALGRFCILHLRAMNSGNRPASFTLPDQVLLDRQKRRFAPDAAATSLFRRSSSQEPLLPVQQLNPGAEVTTLLVYDVPEGVTPELAELHAGRSLGVTVRLGGQA